MNYVYMHSKHVCVHSRASMYMCMFACWLTQICFYISTHTRGLDDLLSNAARMRSSCVMNIVCVDVHSNASMHMCVFAWWYTQIYVYK